MTGKEILEYFKIDTDTLECDWDELCKAFPVFEKMKTIRSKPTWHAEESVFKHTQLAYEYLMKNNFSVEVYKHNPDFTSQSIYCLIPAVRLPYGVKVNTFKGKGHVCDINLNIFGTEIGVNINPAVRDTFSISDVKPYLFPFSSMTEEQNKELNDKLIELELKALCGEIDHSEVAEFEIDFYNKHHIDYGDRRLIEKGLAIDATGLNIY